MKIEKTIKIWKRRNLTPLGRITIIKTFLISKLNHLFSSIPSPGEDYLKRIESLLYKYLWKDQPDKINRKTVTQDYMSGGLKMINIRNFINSQKVTWIRRLLNNGNTDWAKLFEYHAFKISNFSNLGPIYCERALNLITNPFWIDVIKSWSQMLRQLSINTNADLLKSPIWYNPVISKESLFVRKWYILGIKYVTDVVDENGNFLSLGVLKNNLQRSNLEFI